MGKQTLKSVMIGLGCRVPGFYDALSESGCLPEMEKYNISDEVVNEVMGTLKTVDEVKRDPAVFKFYTDQIHRDFDEGFNQEMKNYKLDEATILKIKSAPSMVQKAALFASSVKAVEDSRYNVATLQQKIENLERSLSGNPINHALVNSMSEDYKNLSESLEADAAAMSIEEAVQKYQK